MALGRSLFVTSRLGLLTIACALVGCGSVADGPAEPSPLAAIVPPSPAPTTPLPTETCNGVDDDGNGVVDDAAVCKNACSPTSIDEMAASLRLPRPGDLTVPDGSGETPTLLAITELPALCRGELVPSTATDVVVGCGEVLEVGPAGLSVNTLRVAPGGVVRVSGNGGLAVRDEILVCPGATIASGAGLALTGDGHDGGDIAIKTSRLLLLGTVATRGGWVPSDAAARPGRSGNLRIEVERLLFAGRIDTAETPPRGYRSGAPGDVWLLATKESFFSGSVRSGNALVKVPVCCAE